MATGVKRWFSRGFGSETGPSEEAALEEQINSKTARSEASPSAATTGKRV